ncbi:MAG: hypothetical protein WCT14_08035 [Treponemataceae bacterium]
MKNKKSLMLPSAFFALFIMTAAAQEKKPWSFHAEIDVFLGLKAGAEYRVSDFFGVRGSLGACLISPLMTTYTLVGVWHLRERTSPLQLNFEAGLIQGIFNVLEPMIDIDPAINWASAYWVPGGAASIGYRTRGGHIFSLRAGGGVIFGYDINTWQGPTFQPNIAIEYDFKP